MKKLEKKKIAGVVLVVLITLVLGSAFVLDIQRDRTKNQEATVTSEVPSEETIVTPLPTPEEGYEIVTPTGTP